MQYMKLIPPTRAAEPEPLIDVDLFEDRGIPLSTFDLGKASAFALETEQGENNLITGVLLWIPGLSFDDVYSPLASEEKVQKAIGAVEGSDNLDDLISFDVPEES